MILPPIILVCYCCCVFFALVFFQEVHLTMAVYRYCNSPIHVNLKLSQNNIHFFVDGLKIFLTAAILCYWTKKEHFGRSQHIVKIYTDIFLLFIYFYFQKTNSHLTYVFKTHIWIVTIMTTINCINKNFINPQIAYMELPKKQFFLYHWVQQ